VPGERKTREQPGQTENAPKTLNCSRAVLKQTAISKIQMPVAILVDIIETRRPPSGARDALARFISSSLSAIIRIRYIYTAEGYLELAISLSRAFLIDRPQHCGYTSILLALERIPHVPIDLLEIPHQLVTRTLRRFA
jgi:hypothetical protein